MSSVRVLRTILIVVLGVFAGVALFTFTYARGYSYLSDDPRACVNCHVMRDNFDSWSVSSHRSVTCNGCHTPHQIASKYLVKAQNGFAHSFAFTFEQPEVIRIKQGSLAVVQENCLDCHRATVLATFLVAEHGEPRCAECHPATGHAQ